MADYGLLGTDIGYSFSPSFFEKFWKNKKETHSYTLFDTPSLKTFFLSPLRNTLSGINVTTPFKTDILKFATWHHPDVLSLGASNCLRPTNNGWEAWNTDIIGIQQTIRSLFPTLPTQKRALILGSGGASKACTYVLQSLGFYSTIVSRNPSSKLVPYAEITSLETFDLIVNTTLLGGPQKPTLLPNIPFATAQDDLKVFDMHYFQKQTPFLRAFSTVDSQNKMNGMLMLEQQAIASWDIWNQQFEHLRQQSLLTDS